MISRFITATILVLIAGSLQFTAKADKLEKFIIYGHIYELDDSTGYRSVDSVEVSLMRNDTIAVPFRVLNGNDSLKLSNANMRLLVNSGRGIYDLVFYKEGYDPLLKQVRVTAVSQDQVYVSEIQMTRERNVQLEGVEVKATAIKMVMKGDTIVYNAAAFNTSEGSMLEALVRMFPGAEINSDGQIKVNGKVLNELLINGKDFFSGDPKVALQNLPAYTVDKVKVYDKGADDAYLTKSDIKLTRREEEENLVMDVQLKKEFNKGLLGNVEVGYGLNNRYTGRLFGLMFAEHFRLSAFGNFNNIKDTGSASTDGGWSGGWNEPGVLNLQMGGVDYLYEKGKWRSNGSAKATREDITDHSETAATDFYDTGDVYRRSDSRVKTVRQHFWVKNETNYKGDNVFMRFSPYIEYTTDDSHSIGRSATFSEQPDEQSRVESLDSLFKGNNHAQSRFGRFMMNRLGTISVSNPEHLFARLYTSGTWAPSEMKGKFWFELNGLHSRDETETRSIYDQTIGHDAPEGTTPVRRDSYLKNPTFHTNANGTVTFSQEHNSFSDSYKTGWSLYASANYTYDNNYSRHDYWLATGDDINEYFREDIVLPSLTMPENAHIDTGNSYHTRYTSNQLAASVRWSWQRSALSDDNEKFNPSYRFSVALSDVFNLRHAARNEADGIQTKTQRFNNVQPNATFQFSSSNRKRYLNSSISYYMNMSAPDIFNLMRTTQSTNPFAVYERGLEDLRNAVTHNLSLNLWYSSKGRSNRRHAMFNGSFRKTDNAFGQSKRYDPATGISYYRSINVDGNMNADANISAWTSIGKKDVSLGGYVGGMYTRSVDFVTASTGDPLKSVVNNYNVNVGINSQYSFINGSDISIGGNGSWNGSRSARENFSAINVYSYGAFINGTVKLPREFEIKTSLNFSARRGYDDPNMNTNEWLWNASASKTIMKGSLTFRLSAVDILAQRSSITMRVNAQGSVETWQNSTPRYAMLSVIYRFRSTPKNSDLKANNAF